MAVAIPSRAQDHYATGVAPTESLKKSVLCLSIGSKKFSFRLEKYS